MSFPLWELLSLCLHCHIGARTLVPKTCQRHWQNISHCWPCPQALCCRQAEAALQGGRVSPSDLPAASTAWQANKQKSQRKEEKFNQPTPIKESWRDLGNIFVTQNKKEKSVGKTRHFIFTTSQHQPILNRLWLPWLCSGYPLWKPNKQTAHTLH